MKTKKRKTIYNIGYQGRTPEQLIGMLKEAGVTLLVDLREKPYSRIVGFNQKRFSLALSKQEIGYEWMGHFLGGFTCKDNWIEAIDSYEEIAQAIQKVCAREKIHNYATAVLLLARYAEEYMKLIDAGEVTQATRSASS